MKLSETTRILLTLRRETLELTLTAGLGEFAAKDLAEDLHRTQARIAELECWLQDAAVQDCRECDGTGIFYGNIAVCHCVNREPRRLADAC